MYKRVVTVGNACLINDAKNPKVFPVASDSAFWVTWLSLYATRASNLQMWHWPMRLLSTSTCFWLNYTMETTVTIWIYPVVSGCQLVSPPLLMKLVFGMPWCTLRRFAPRNSVMYSMGTLGCCFRIIFKLIGLYISRSIANPHHVSLALLKVSLFIPMRRIILIVTICFHSNLVHITYLCPVIGILRRSIEQQAQGWLHFGLLTSIMIGINKGILRLDFIKV
jgi:hypothetical protein